MVDFYALFLEMASMEKPDERAVMTYVSSYYHAFSSSQQVSEYCSWYMMVYYDNIGIVKDRYHRRDQLNSHESPTYERRTPDLHGLAFSVVKDANRLAEMCSMLKAWCIFYESRPTPKIFNFKTSFGLF